MDDFCNFFSSPKKRVVHSFKKPKEKLKYMRKNDRLLHFGYNNRLHERDQLLRKVMKIKNSRHVSLKKAWSVARK